jgi:hypothetical protein
LDERRRELGLRLADEDLDARVGRRLAEVEAVDVLQVHQQLEVAHSYSLLADIRQRPHPNAPKGGIGDLPARYEHTLIIAIIAI